MEATDTFKNAIRAYLDSRAVNDELFAATYAKEGKNIDDCVTYILNTVQKSGCNGFADEEIFGMAVHYYDEDKIEVGKPITGKVVVNHSVEITEEDIATARQKALDELVAEQKKKIAAKPKATAKPEVQQASLF
ncbi:MAG: hypothetical protein BGO30_08330 [Bacteroidetes bacterium 41-46]|nr:MAG: hypothetical protein BGO30_08330 [Bacteroidetes bacterium 41-46]